jgi:hypothetical protein
VGPVGAVVLLLAAVAGDVVRVSRETRHLLPRGKEVDAIDGDYLLRNDRVVAVIGSVAPGRHANLSCRSVQGALIDFTLLEADNDQLSAYYPHGDRNGAGPGATQATILSATGPELAVEFRRPAGGRDPVEAVTRYSLRDGERFLKVVTRYANRSAAPVEVRVADKMRCDQTFAQTAAGDTAFVVFHDRWFGAAYAVVRPEGRLRTDGRHGGMFSQKSGSLLDFPDHVENELEGTRPLAPGGEIVLTRYVTTGRHFAEVQAEALLLLGLPSAELEVVVSDPSGTPVEGALVELHRDERRESEGLTDRAGRLRFRLPPGAYRARVSGPGRPPTAADVHAPSRAAVKLTASPASTVEFDVRDGAGTGIPCKVQFIPLDGTPLPDLGPKQRANGCGNLFHSPRGRFDVPLPPGRYLVIVSRGPEHDVVRRILGLREGETARLAARLPRTVDTTGWISADFHNHSTPSGDNTTGVDDRIVCLAAEHVEFAPATEHNRILSYREPIRRLGLERVLATSDGIELTTGPLPLAHVNAFPLVLREGMQDNGGPPTGPDPLTQIRRLFDHDEGAEKLMQQNHPDIGWLVFDADGDQRPDQGFGTFRFTHVIEAWGSDILDMRPLRSVGVSTRNNNVFNWLQLLNQGHRIPAVANSDAHYCIHESGRVRNFVKSPTDEPAEIQELDVVRAARAGRMVMSNGPFLEVDLSGRGPGETLEGRKGELRVRVQCPNWLDVDRIEVLVNGRPSPALAFRRSTHPARFGDGVVKFEGRFPMEFAADAHVVVVAVGEQSGVGPVMGPTTEIPCAIANPIWVDADGGGISPTLDTLDAPLPVRRAPLR